MKRGLYRDGENAYVDWGATEGRPFLTRDTYTANGYEPAFDDLPTEEEYEASRNA
jgi:hypothetical protein